MSFKRIWKNMFSSVLVYGAQVLLNLYVSRLVLLTYGSEMNGLVSSTGQIFTYIALLEAGIGTATINAFYKPVAEKNVNAINDVYSASLQYYRRTAIWYLLCMVVASVIWPLYIDTKIDYWYIVAIILIQGFSNVLTFFYTSTISSYLQATGRNYVNSYMHLAFTFAISAVKIVICSLTLDYIFIALSQIALNAIKSFSYYVYRKKCCSGIAVIKKADQSLLKQRKAFLIHEISGTVFSSTDLIVLSVFCDLRVASIYTVYSMVVTSIASVIGQVFNSLIYILGDAHAQKDHFEKTTDIFSAIYIPSVFILYTVTYIMLLPFISVYTRGITDINYIDPWLPFLFVMIQLLSSCRIVDSAVIKIAHHAKQTISRTIAETTINLVVSLVCVQFIGIYGVLLGTIAAMLYRSNDMVLYTNKYIFKRSAIKEYKLYLLNLAVFFVFVVLNSVFVIAASTYWELLWTAVLVTVCVFIAYVAVNSLVSYRLLLTTIKGKLLKTTPMQQDIATDK